MNITFDLEVLSNMYCGYTIKEIAELLDKKGLKYEIKEGHTPTPFYIDYITTIKDFVEPMQESNEYIRPLQEQKMPYVHYEVMKRYTEDAETSEKPWQHWYFNKFKGDKNWIKASSPLIFAPDREYKREVIPVALTSKPKPYEKYFTPKVSTKINLYEIMVWTNSVEDNYFLQNKLAFATPEEAHMVANAMMDFVAKMYGNN